MAIQGYEQDQVMVTPQGKPGLNPDQDVSVPINWYARPPTTCPTTLSHL